MNVTPVHLHPIPWKPFANTDVEMQRETIHSQRWKTTRKNENEIQSDGTQAKQKKTLLKKTKTNKNK